jgi:hypothetical protein
MAKEKIITLADFDLFCKSMKKYLPQDPTAKEIDDMNWPIPIEVEIKGYIKKKSKRVHKIIDIKAKELIN